MRIVAGPVEVIARLSRLGDTIVLEDFSIDGDGAGSLGFRSLKELGRRFARQQNAPRLIVRGTVRTTGASPGEKPRENVIVV